MKLIDKAFAKIYDKDPILHVGKCLIVGHAIAIALLIGIAAILDYFTHRK